MKRNRTASEHSKYRIGVWRVPAVQARRQPVTQLERMVCAPRRSPGYAQPGAVAAALAGLIASGGPCPAPERAALYGLRGSRPLY